MKLLYIIAFLVSTNFAKIDWDKVEEVEKRLGLWSESESDDSSSEVALSDSDSVDFDSFDALSAQLESLLESDSLEQVVGSEDDGRPSSRANEKPVSLFGSRRSSSRSRGGFFGGSRRSRGLTRGE